MSELARVGLVEMLRRSLDEQDESAVYEQYSRGDINEDVARVLLGEKIDQMQEEKEEFESAMEQESSSFLCVRSCRSNCGRRLVRRNNLG